MFILSFLTIFGISSNRQYNFLTVNGFIVSPPYLINNNRLVPPLSRSSSQIHKTIPTHRSTHYELLSSTTNNNNNNNEVITSTVNNNNNNNNNEVVDNDNDNEKVINLLKHENQLLKHEIQLLQDTNKILRTNTENIIIETFEGEGKMPNKWFQDDDDDGDDEEEEEIDFILQQDDDETDEYWLNNSKSSATNNEMSVVYDEECLIPDGDDVFFNSDACPIEPNLSFQSALRDRALWLVGLLLLQSFSGIILSKNEELIQTHPFIVYFLTMLVGAGGNAGNQASVRVIRGLALGTLNENTQNQFLSRELKMAFCLSGILSIAGFVRAFLFKTPLAETFAITSALCCIVLISICLGAVLPLFLKKLGVDPAHSSTSIQVIMDVLGVFITVLVCGFILDSSFGQFAISKLSL